MIHSAFTTSMAAHTSPVYVEVHGRPFVPSADEAAVVEQVIAGARTWVAELAAIDDPADRDRMVAYFAASLGTFRERLGDRGRADRAPPGARRSGRGLERDRRSAAPPSRRRPRHRPGR